MATSQQFLAPDNSTDAGFRVWGKAISDFLTSISWTKTADTGQVNWATVTVPAANTFVYEIWQPGDALQTGATVYYVKLEYGNSTGSTNQPRMRVSAGTSTNGAGTLTGFTLGGPDVFLNSGTGAGSTTPFECDFSGDSGRFSLLLFRNNTASVGVGYVAVERTKNTDGTSSSDGVSVMSVTNTNNSENFRTIVFGVGASLSMTNANFPCIIAGAPTTSAFNNNISITPVFPWYGKFGNPLTVAGYVYTGDVAESGLFTASLYGATRTYMATGALNVRNNLKLCTRYD